MERMVAFWRDALGCTVEKVQAELGLVHIRAGSALVDLVDIAGKLGKEGGRAPGSEGRNLDHFCLRVEPFDPPAIRQRLQSLGIPFDEPKRRFGAEGYGDSIYLTDPEGNRIELKGASEPGAR
jgi:catechol 2,3-dioxygenase-like lactoylglutathione lyase family enzyme